MYLHTNFDDNLLILGAKLIHCYVLANLWNVVFEVKNIEFICDLLDIAISNIFELI